MRVEITIDPDDRRDAALRDEINAWLSHATRDTWAVSEADTTDDDGEALTILAYRFHDPLDAMDLYHRHCSKGRGRLI